jgi:hypothetical protein
LAEFISKIVFPSQHIFGQMVDIIEGQNVYESIIYQTVLVRKMVNHRVGIFAWLGKVLDSAKLCIKVKSRLSNALPTI